MLIALALIQSFGLASLYYAAAALIARRYERIAPYAAFAPFVVLGLTAFWLVYAIPAAAPVINIAAWVAVIPAVIIALRSSLHRDAAVAAGLWVATYLALTLYAFLPTGQDQMTTVAQSRFSHALPLDNILPLLFADGLLAGHVPSPLVGTWLASDRPPLQTGLYLALRLPGAHREASYQLVTTGLQMSVIAATYLLARAMGAGRIVAALGSLIAFLAPITIINGIFVWPKLLSAALLMAAAAIHFTPLYKESSRSVAAGAAVGIVSIGAMLAHGSAGFTLVAFATVALVAGRWGSLRYSATAIVVAAALYMPWAAYQKYADPPGDRLLKWHFAGEHEASDARSVTQTIRDSYSNLTFDQYKERLAYKIGKSLGDPLLFLKEPNRFEARNLSFFSVLQVTGVVGIFLIGILMIAPFLGYGLFAAIIGINYAFWVVSIFDRDGAIVHASSYFMVMSAFPLLAAICNRHPVVMAAILAGQSWLFTYYFV